MNPTVGRIVHYHPDPIEGEFKAAPLAAIVVRVWTPDLVNLTVFDDDGDTHQRTSVPFSASGEDPPIEGIGYATWPAREDG